MSTISVDYDVLNQRGSPAWFTDTFANIPTAGYVGRMFISKDTFAFYRDTGTGWDLIGGPGIGTLTGSGVVGQVSFFNGTQVLAGNNNLFWDNTNSRLGINTTTPGVALDIHATGTNAQFNGTGTNNAYLVFQNAGTSKWRIGNTYNAGANSYDIYNNFLASTTLSINGSTNALTINGNTDINTILNTKQLSVYGDVSNAGVIQLKQLGSISVNSGYVGLASFTANTFGVYFPVANTSIIFDNTLLNANRIYQYPNANGILALTSDLSGYLPLTGGTLTGALVINPTNTLTIGLDVASNTTRFRSDNLEGFKRQLEIVMGSGTLVQLTAKGYLANYGTDMAFYTATTGGTNASPGIYITGTNNRVGIKTGTPAYDLDVAGTFNVSSTSTFSNNATISSATTYGFIVNSTNNASFRGFTIQANGTTQGGIEALPNTGEIRIGAYSTTNDYFPTFYSDGVEIMRITSGGNVLIGTTTDDGNKLQVNGSVKITGNIFLTGYIRSSTGYETRVDGSAGITPTFYLSNVANNRVWNIQLGASNELTTWYYDGSSWSAKGYQTTSGVWTNSDIRKKKDIEDLNYGLDEVLKLKPKKYKYIHDIDNKLNGKKDMGFIAQEVIDIIPEAVGSYIENDTEFLSMSYANLVPILVKAIQELNEKLVRNNIN